MIGKDFERLLGQVAGIPATEVEQRMRDLRRLDLLPKGGRGPHAPNIEEQHMATAILGLVARRAVDAGEVALRAASLRPLTFDGFMETDQHFYRTILHVLGWALALGPDSEAFRRLRRIVVAEDGSIAWVSLHGLAGELVYGDSALAELAQKDPMRFDLRGAEFLGRHYVIEGGALLKIARLVREHDAGRD